MNFLFLFPYSDRKERGCIFPSMQQLSRTLTPATVMALVVGGVIGSGIFMKPAVMLLQLGSPLLLILVWVLAGLITLCGALTNAEAAAMFPETGGQYVFFQRMYGNGFAFLYGWSAFAVFNTAGNASIAWVCSSYANYFLHLPSLETATEMKWSFHLPMIGTVYPLKELPVKLLTIFLIILFTLINRRSVQWGGGIQRWLTVIKLLAIFGLITGIFFSGKGQLSHFSGSLSNAPSGWMLFPAFMAAMSGAFWAYDGWNNITFIAGEIREPQRTIPRSLAAGLSICIIVYVLLNLSYVLSLSPEKMSGSAFIAADAAASVWGMFGAALIVMMVVASTLGTANANVLATARVTFAMGKESSWLASAGKVHPRFQTPSNALVLNAVWSCVLIFSGSFDTLTDMLIFVTWFFYGMSALGLFVLRFRMPDAARPYKVAGYPYVPGLFLLFTCFFLGTTFYNDLVQYQNGTIPMMHSVLGIVITAAGLPVYFFSVRRNKK